MSREYDRRNIAKIPTTPEEQLDKLRERGCLVEDEKRAVQVLKDINYFRLAYYFSLFLETKGKYREGTSFDRVMRIYDFDRRLRSLLLEILEEIEISLRAHCSNFHAIKYGTLGYLNGDNFARVHKHQQFLGRVERLIESNEDSDLVKHYKGKHGGKFPLWVITELFSFGSLNVFYKDLKPADKTEIAQKHYHMSSGALENRIDRLSELRNHCAHYHRLYDSAIGNLAENNSLFDHLLIMKEVYSRPDNWNGYFVERLKGLCGDYGDVVETERLGFPEDWSEQLTIKCNE